MAVSDLTNTTWVFEQNIYNKGSFSYNINFTSNNNSYTSVSYVFTTVYSTAQFKYNNTRVCEIEPGEGAYWYPDEYKTISITGGTDVTNATLIAWLEANAVQQIDEPDVTYDLTQLDSYLVPGTSYTVTAKAVATGYADSVASNSVTYVPSGPTPSGYSGNIICGSSQMYGRDGNCYIKFGSTPTSASDYDAYADGISETLIGTTSYSNQTVAYIWQGYGFEYNGIDVEIVMNNQTYQTAYQLTLTTNGDITLYPCYED